MLLSDTHQRTYHPDGIARYSAAAKMSRITLIVTLLLSAALAPFARAELVTPSECLSYLRRYEGVSTAVYRDPSGTGYSVGVGHWLGRVRPTKMRYTETEVLALFYRDLAVHLEACRSGVRDFAGLPKPVQLTTLGLAWGVGPTGFKRFKNFRLALSYRAWEAAKIELLDSRWAHQISQERLRSSLLSLDR